MSYLARSGLASRPWLVVPGVAAIHATCAIGFLFDPAVGSITALALIHTLAGRFVWLVLLVTAVISVLPMIFHMSAAWIHRCLWPQQALLFLMAYSAVAAALRGKYPDGVERSFAFIFTDQCWAVYLMIMHLAATLRNAWLGRYGNGRFR